MNIRLANSFVAKAWGLWEGLRLARERGLHGVEVKIDTKAFVHAINNKQKDDHGTGILILDCKNLLTSDNFKGLSHTLREGNKCADFLANRGMEICGVPPVGNKLRN